MSHPILNAALRAGEARRRRGRDLAAGLGLAALGLLAFLLPAGPTSGARQGEGLPVLLAAATPPGR